MQTLATRHFHLRERRHRIRLLPRVTPRTALAAIGISRCSLRSKRMTWSGSRKRFGSSRKRSAMAAWRMSSRRRHRKSESRSRHRAAEGRRRASGGHHLPTSPTRRLRSRRSPTSTPSEPHLFNALAATKDEGLDLGLSIRRKTVAGRGERI